jgi:hypothetical protein
MPQIPHMPPLWRSCHLLRSLTVHDDWLPERAEAVLRPKRRRRLLQPLRERHFTYAAYAAFLDRLSGDDRVRPMSLRELATAPRDRIAVGLRHDVDLRLENALRLARLEHDRGLSATYFVLHTAEYWRRADLVERLLELQSLGHEVGWHNDLVTLEVVRGGDARSFLRTELDRLRATGVDIRGTSAHGSFWGHALGYSNLYFFSDFTRPVDGFPNVDEVVVDGENRAVPKGTLAEFGFEYEAYHLGEDLYASDSRFNERGQRWHPERFDVDRLVPGQTAIVLVHPCHWDTSLAGKYVEHGRRALRFVRRLS